MVKQINCLIISFPTFSLRACLKSLFLLVFSEGKIFDIILIIEYNGFMDVFSLTKSKTRRKIINLFLKDPEKPYYLHEIKRVLHLSAGNIRRELLSLTQIGIFDRAKKGKVIYYKINTLNPYYNIIMSLSTVYNKKLNNNIINKGFLWVNQNTPLVLDQNVYCQSRDVFSVRLDSYSRHLEDLLGKDAYLISAICGEIGNNSFDHNLGNWPSTPGIYFAYDLPRKTVVLADRGQGILKTIRNVKPETKDDNEALKVAFTQIISGRFPEQRGNGLKFVTRILKEKHWSLKFRSGHAILEIDRKGHLAIKDSNILIYGCFAVIKY